jgi:hypothetical protein
MRLLLFLTIVQIATIHNPLILLQIANFINCYYKTDVVFSTTKYFRFRIGFFNKFSTANSHNGPRSLKVTNVSGKSKFGVT